MTLKINLINNYLKNYIILNNFYYLLNIKIILLYKISKLIIILSLINLYKFFITVFINIY